MKRNELPSFIHISPRDSGEKSLVGYEWKCSQDPQKHSACFSTQPGRWTLGFSCPAVTERIV